MNPEIKKFQDRLKASISQEPKKVAVTTIPRDRFLSTGVTLLNLAHSNTTYGGYTKGHYYFLVGDSTSGKTWLMMSAFAEAAHSEAFKDYELIFDNVEDGALMDLERYFGAKTAARIKTPGHIIDGEEKCSETVEDFYDNIDSCLSMCENEKKSMIYVLDSQDALTSRAQNAKFKKNKKSREKDEKETGSFGDGKAKIHSENIRRVIAGIKKTNSILIIISQTRDNLGFGFETKTRSGGKALRFYACMEDWTSIIEKLKKTVRGKPRGIGTKVRVQNKKNRLTGRHADVCFDILNATGIDDTGSCIDYLVEEGHWKTGKGEAGGEAKPKEGRGKSSGSIKAVEFDFSGNREALVSHIEDNNLEPELKKIVGRVWREIVEASKVKRKQKYAE